LKSGFGWRFPRPRLFPVGAAIALTAILAQAVVALAAVKVGGSGPDNLIGTARADTLRGLVGNDTLTGKSGGDKLLGGPGADKLSGGPGSDQLLGEGGNDRLLAKDGAADTVNCGSGSGDVATVDPVDKVSANCERVEGLPVDQPAAPNPPASPSVAPESPKEEKEPPVEEGGEDELEFEERPIAMFPSGHGWTNNGVGSFGDAGGPFIVNGDRSYRITTNGLGNESVATSPPLEAVDLRKSHVSVHGLVSFSGRLEDVKLRLASGNIATDYAEVTVWREDLDPVILGSTFEFQTLPLGDFAVTGSVDWSQIDRAQLILTDNEASTEPVSFYAAGIYAVPTERKATISFAFDDGHASTITRGLKKLSTYRYPATAYVIADIVGNAGNVTLEQLYQLRDQHHWEIGGHSYSIAAHNLPDGLTDLNPAQLKTEMDSMRDWLDEKGFRRTSMAYPKGAQNPEVRQYVARDFCLGRVTARGPETLPPRDRYTMRGWSINGLESKGPEVEATIDKAAADGTWLILSFHDIVGGVPTESTDFNDGEFDDVVDHVRALQKEGKVRVRTVDDAASRYC
jgi:Polysaccharide deacetylase/RTX calcium-binding nonapeptide repeat (4 copies)